MMISKNRKSLRNLRCGLFFAASCIFLSPAVAAPFNSYGAQTGTSSSQQEQYQTPVPSVSQSQMSNERDDTSITELSTCQDAIAILTEARNSGGASYDVLARMVGDMVEPYVVEDENQVPVNGVHSFLFSRTLHFCQLNPQRTMMDGIHQAKHDLDAIIQQGIASSGN